MNQQKKCIEITGSLICPIQIGAAALICEGEFLRRTSPVLGMDNISQTEIQFETQNTNYLLHITTIPELVGQEVMK